VLEQAFDRLRDHPKLSDNSHHIGAVPKSRERRCGERAVSVLVERYPCPSHSDENGLDLGLLEVTDTALANDGFELHAFHPAHGAQAQTKASRHLSPCQELAGGACQHGRRHDLGGKRHISSAVLPHFDGALLPRVTNCMCHDMSSVASTTRLRKWDAFSGARGRRGRALTVTPRLTDLIRDQLVRFSEARFSSIAGND